MVGHYPEPPDNALVLCAGEKPHIKAWSARGACRLLNRESPGAEKVKKSRVIIFGLVIAISLILCFSRDLALGYLPHNVIINRVFDKYRTALNDYITVTVSINNAESYDLRGFCYIEHIPEVLLVFPVSVKVNGRDVSNYIFESGNAGDVYPDCVPYRWVFETPSGFQEDNPIRPGDYVEIIYFVSSTCAGSFELNEFDWFGFYENSIPEDKAAFGVSMSADNTIIRFLASMPWLMLLLGD